MGLIDVDALKGQLYFRDLVTTKLIERLDEAPTVDPVKHGRWIFDRSFDPPTCSACLKFPRTPGFCGTKTFYLKEFVFCPHCGAKMDGVIDK